MVYKHHRPGSETVLSELHQYKGYFCSSKPTPHKHYGTKYMFVPDPGWKVVRWNHECITSHGCKSKRPPLFTRLVIYVELVRIGYENYMNPVTVSDLNLRLTKDGKSVIADIYVDNGPADVKIIWGNYGSEVRKINHVQSVPKKLPAGTHTICATVV